MKIKLSKSQWEGIGKKAGWMKRAMLTHVLNRIMERGDEGLSVELMDREELQDAKQYEKAGVLIKKKDQMGIDRYFDNKEHKPDFEKSKKYMKDLIKTPLNEDSIYKRRFVKVTFNDGDVVQTSINGTKKEIEDYYMKQDFEKQDESGSHRGVKVEFLA